MNKNLIIAAVVIVILVLGVAGYMILGKSKSPVSSSNQEADTNQSAISSVRDAILGGSSITCDYTNSQGNRIVANIKSGKVRTDITDSSPDESGSIIIRDNKMYFWNSKAAMVMDVPDFDAPITPGQSSNSAVDQSEMMADLENYKQFCKAGNVDDSLFEIPTNVTFQSMSQMMPSGSQAVPSGMSPVQMEQLMQQYQQ